jgi:hypothetical protein
VSDFKKKSDGVPHFTEERFVKQVDGTVKKDEKKEIKKVDDSLRPSASLQGSKKVEPTPREIKAEDLNVKYYQKMIETPWGDLIV